MPRVSRPFGSHPSYIPHQSHDIALCFRWTDVNVPSVEASTAEQHCTLSWTVELDSSWVAEAADFQGIC